MALSYFFFYQVINDYFKLLKDDETADTEDIVYLSCNFFTGSSRSQNYQNTESLVTIKTKFIIIPYNLNYNHWCLIIVDVAETSLLYFDSIRNRLSELSNFFKKVNNWLLKMNVLRKKLQIIDMSQKNDLFPCQGDNKTECGVFVMMFADYFINGLVLDFNLRDMITFRKKIFLSLCSKNLNYSTNFYPACSLVKNNYLIRFQSLLSKPHNTVTSSICRVLIDNFIIFDREYVIVPDVIGSVLNIPNFTGCFTTFENIDFDTTYECLRKQSTKLLRQSQLKKFFKVLVDALGMFFSVLSSEKSVGENNFHFEYKLLKSSPNCPKQKLHQDCERSLDSTSYDIQYSLLIAIESNTKLLLSDNKTTIDIPINGMIMFRGDYMHAGMSYRTENRRVFASCSNKPLENKNVFVAESKCN